MNNVKYKLKELTPQEYLCILGTCPRIYELAKLECGVGACPKVYSDENKNYLIIGKKVNPQKFGLEEKIGKNETLISIPKDLIDKLNK